MLYLRLMINSFVQAFSSISLHGNRFVDLGAIQRLSISVAILSMLQSRPGIRVPTNAGLYIFICACMHTKPFYILLYKIKNKKKIITTTIDQQKTSMEFNNGHYL